MSIQLEVVPPTNVKAIRLSASDGTRRLVCQVAYLELQVPTMGPSPEAVLLHLFLRGDRNLLTSSQKV